MTMVARELDFSDALNPVLVKELRQGMKSRSFATAFLAMQALMVGSVAFQVLLRGNATASEAMNAAFWACAGLPLVIFLPLGAIGAIHTEHRQETLSLVLLTRLTPWRMVTGKWASLMAQSSLIASATLPYTVIRYFLGGIDTVRDLLAIALMLGASALLCACGLLVSTFKKPWTLFTRGLILMLVLSPLTAGLFFPIILIFYAMSARPDLIPLQLVLAAFCVLHGAAARFTDFRTGQRVMPRIGALLLAMLLIGCVQVGALYAPCYIGLVFLLPLAAWLLARAAALAWPNQPHQRRTASTVAAAVLGFLLLLRPGTLPAPGTLFFLVTLSSACLAPLYILLLLRRWLGATLIVNYLLAQVVLMPLLSAPIAGYLHNPGTVPPVLHIAPVASLVLTAIGHADPAYFWPNAAVAGLCLLGLAWRFTRQNREAPAHATV